MICLRTRRPALALAAIGVVTVLFGIGGTTAQDDVLAATPAPPSLYVSTTGRNSNPCTQSAPCATLNRAYQVASPGDVVQIAGGSYPAQTLLSDPSKTSPADVVFQPAPAAVVTVAGDLTLGTTSGCNGAKHLTFRNLTIAGSPVARPCAEDVTFDRLDAASLNISGATGVAVLGGDYGPKLDSVAHVKQGASDILIDGARFHDFTISDPANHSECLMIWGGAGNVTVRNSSFRNCTDFDILVKGSSGNVVIESSFFDEPMPGETATVNCNPGCPRGGNAIAFSDGSGYVVRYASLLGGIRVDREVSNVVLKGNAGSKSSCQGNVGFSFNVWSAAKCSASDKTASLQSLFVGPTSASFDLHLIAGSPAIGAGDSTDHPVRDIDGRLRPVGFPPDAGAWQREPALVDAGRAIGSARIGMGRNDVIALYGTTQQRTKQKLPDGTSVDLHEYRVRGGKLRVGYRNDVVVMIATTSAFYRTAKGVTVGVPMRARANDDGTCRPVGARKGKARLYLRPKPSKAPVVAELIVVAARFVPLCATPPKP